MQGCQYIAQYYIIVCTVFASAKAAFFHTQTVFQQKSVPGNNSSFTIQTQNEQTALSTQKSQILCMLLILLFSTLQFAVHLGVYVTYNGTRY
jgi:hypothetical protein